MSLSLFAKICSREFFSIPSFALFDMKRQWQGKNPWKRGCEAFLAKFGDKKSLCLRKFANFWPHKHFVYTSWKYFCFRWHCASYRIGEQSLRTLTTLMTEITISLMNLILKQTLKDERQKLCNSIGPFAKINSREIYWNYSFAKLNSREIKRISKLRSGNSRN